MSNSSLLPYSSKKNVIIIVGATAVGKTTLAIHLSNYFNTSIVSADSRQCYKELNIGVAKPTKEELQSTHHYFIDTYSIHNKVDAAVFENDALKAVDEIFTTNTIAIMVGGTGMYIKAFCEGLDFIPKADETIQLAVRKGYEEKGLEWLQNRVETEDPEYFKTGETQNPQRLMRALEVKRSTGKSIRSFQNKMMVERPFNIIKIGLELTKTALHERIHHRVDMMMQNGLLQEVKSLFPYQHLNALQTVGYKEIFDHLNGLCSLEASVEFIKTNTRQYAKRQMTWFKKEKDIKWFNPIDMKSILAYLREKLL